MILHQTIHIIISILLIISVLSQSQGSGLSGAIGGTEQSAIFAKRGIDKILQNITIVLGILFALSSFLFIFNF